MYCTFSKSCSPASEYFVLVESSHRDILTYSQIPMKNMGSTLSNLAHIFTKASNRSSNTLLWSESSCAKECKKRKKKRKITQNALSTL